MEAHVDRELVARLDEDVGDGPGGGSSRRLVAEVMLSIVMLAGCGGWWNVALAADPRTVTAAIAVAAVATSRRRSVGLLGMGGTSGTWAEKVRD